MIGNFGESLFFIELSSSCYYLKNGPVNERCKKPHYLLEEGKKKKEVTFRKA